MKQSILFAALLLSLTSLQAQISNPKLSVKTTRTTDTVKQVGIKVNAPNTYVKPPAPLPDLRLSTLGFSFVNSQVVDGVTMHTFQINYTVKNEGTLAIAANSVHLQGYASFGGTNPRTVPACGSTLTTLAWQMIPAGATFSGWFRCTMAFDKNNPPLYKLYVDPDNTVKEISEDNNGAQMTILF
jgi:hypothetical protein